jgi:hypothetical protein
MGEIEKLPDDSCLYSVDEFKKKLASGSVEKDQLLISDIIFILLAAHIEKPIYGRTMFMKQIFLLTEEILNKDVLKKEKLTLQKSNFIPYMFGPYSFTVMETIDGLKYSGNIVVTGKKNSRKESFSLSDKAKKKATKIFSKLPNDVKKAIREKRVGWDQLGNDGILRYVYLKYPDYKEKSMLKERYSEIQWGIGRA